jgi:hypothetical protein
MMKKWPPILWLIFVAFISLVIGIVTLLVVMYLRAGVLQWYGLCIGVFIVYFLIQMVRHKETHVHHYNVGIAMVALCGYQNLAVTAISAYFNGIFTEGSTRWGYDPIFSNCKFAIVGAKPPEEQKIII